MKAEPICLFVYGTLLGGISDCNFCDEDCQTARQLLRRRGSLLGKGSVSGRLFAVDWYPALVRSREDDVRALGEVWRLDPASSAETLAELDRYEGDDYARERMHVVVENGMTTPAWVYVYDAPIRGAPKIDSGDFALWINRQSA